MSVRRVDAFAHILPKRYLARLERHLETTNSAGLAYYREGVFDFDRTISDLDPRFREMDRHGDYRQVLVLGVPPLEDLGPPAVAAEFARFANDEMAEIVRSHPDRFAGFAAALPLNDPERAVEELDRAVRDLDALGGLLYTNVSGRPLDDARFEPLLTRFEELRRVAWLHPTRDASRADYATESRSDYGLWWSLGWPYETAAAIARLVCSGAMERHPDLRILAHHGGGMVPHFAARLAMGPGYRQVAGTLPQPMTEYFRRFYADTALFGAPHAVRCVIEFFGTGHVLFGSDVPLGPPACVETTIADIEAAGLAPADAEAVFAGNASRLLGV